MDTPKIELTKDGSNTLVHPKYNAHYHSTAGAIIESDFVYIKSGLDFFIESTQEKSVSVLEIGFGSGLNAINTYRYAIEHEVFVEYIGVEKYPVSLEVVQQLNFLNFFSIEDKEKVFIEMHQSIENKNLNFSEFFNFKKRFQDFSSINSLNQYDVIYFDAFAPNDQPELWTENLFSKMYASLKPNGVLVTYCAQGHARRAMQAAGFSVKRIPGPPSKRHITRAVKI